MKTRFFVFISLVFLTACSTNSGQFDRFLFGKVDKMLSVNGTDREYTLHVPTGYQGNKALPLVLVLHDQNSSGHSFYQSSGWPAICERENVFAVFPSALSYCTASGGTTINQRLWNAASVAPSPVCAGITMADDVAFFRQLIERLVIDYNIDKKRIYVAGFGNGGQMAAVTALSIGDKVAASVQFAGSFGKIGSWTAVRDVPVLFQAGNLDEVFFGDKYGLALTSLEEGLKDDSNPLSYITRAYKNIYGLGDNFTLAGDTLSVITALFYKNTQKPLLEISLIRDTGHVYPSGNQGFKAAEQHWNWLRTFQLP